MKKVGIVGCGNIARTHAWALNNLDGVSIVSLADCVIEKAEMMSRECTESKARVYASLGEMLEAEELDAVHICTPHYLHVPMIKECINSGVAAFSEKPPAISSEEFEELKCLVKDLGESKGKNHANIGFCFQNRYNETVIKAREIVDDGSLGKLTGARAFVTWRRDENYYETDWKGKLSTEGGGALINQSIHTLDLILEFLGAPDKVYASLSNHHLKGKVEVEDTVEAWLSYEDGKRACFYASTAYATDAPVIIELQLEKGRVSMIDNCLTVYRQNEMPKIQYVEETKGVGKAYWGNGHLKCIKDFYSCLESGNKFKNDLDSVENTMRVMMEIYKNRI